ncbi:hypothetical protein DSL72_008143 [Monilinia vaccinii-corymbosi]|uniref:BZIP domain-containing protein n=1 Tax=Monilinia vaccinii-corymbosi TaxID=61207 RepID=A0A8A3PJX0_9HELO|nr:hypothetical protein DSL72_008143 [Monilinia vaccinii-corymbosi]
MASQLQFIEPAGKTFFIASTITSASSEHLSKTSTVTGQNRRHSSHLASASPSLQNQRVAAIIQSTGHSTSASSFINRFTSPRLSQNPHQNQYQHRYPSAPDSPANLQIPKRPRPQVPLFSKSTGSVPPTPNMVFQDMDLFDEFTAFEGGASTHNPYSSVFNSPVASTIYDPTNNISSSSSINMGTVSPKDLSLRDLLTSAPNSAAYTNLTSPSVYSESPAFENYDDSPFSKNSQVFRGDPWFSLFPEEVNVQPPNVIEYSPLRVEEDLDMSEQRKISERLDRKPNNRRKSGSKTSPASAPAGIRKRAAKPLAPIVVEDITDKPKMKRANNTMAARRSRQKKLERLRELEDQLAEAIEERDHWKAIALQRGG